MILLDSTRSIDVVLSANATTTEWDFFTSYIDLVASGLSLPPPAPADGVTTGVTSKTVVAAPSASTIRQVKFISISNRDTVLGTVTIRLYNGSSRRVLTNIPLQPNEELFYIDGIGWQVFDANGNLKGTGSQGLNAGLKYSYSTNTANTDPTSGFLKFDNATLASIANMRINGTDADGRNVNAFVTTWDASTTTAHRGWLLVYKDGAPGNFVLFEVTGAQTNNTTWYNFPITYNASGGSLANSDTIRAIFIRTGDKGATGSQGLYGGAVTLDYKWDTGTSDADPGAGLVRGNNATTASITSLFIDLVDQNSQSQAAVIDTFPNSTSTTKGHLRLVNKADVTKWMIFTISAWTTASGYRKLTVAQVSQSGASPFASNDEILIEFTRVGDIGSTGATGAAGATQTGINLGNGGAALSANYTTVLGDAGLELQHAVGDNNARTFTIDSNANVAYAIGTVLLFVNLKNTLTIAITSDTMTLVNSATTGSRTLAVNGVAVAIKVGTTSWIIGGSGLT